MSRRFFDELSGKAKRKNVYTFFAMYGWASDATIDNKIKIRVMAFSTFFSFAFLSLWKVGKEMKDGHE